MAGQAHYIETDFPKQGTVLLGKISTINKVEKKGSPLCAHIDFKIQKIWGPPQMTIASTIGDNTVQEDNVLNLDQVIHVTQHAHISFDPDGSPLALLQVRGALDVHTLLTHDQTQPIVYLPSHNLFFEATPAMINMIKSTREQTKTSASQEVVDPEKILIDFYEEYASNGTGVQQPPYIIRDFLLEIKKENGIVFENVYSIGPLGKEGEFAIALSLEQLTPTQQREFKNQYLQRKQKIWDAHPSKTNRSIFLGKPTLLFSAIPKNSILSVTNIQGIVYSPDLVN